MSLLRDLRENYHREICLKLLGRRKGILSNADKGSKTSCDLAEKLAARLIAAPSASPPTGQGLGAGFARITKKYLEEAFSLLAHLRPGEWRWALELGISNFEQYEHLDALARLVRKHREVASVLAGDYVITPDIVVARLPASETSINQGREVISQSENIAKLTGLRATNQPRSMPSLLASISCKWTIRSDRAQNARTEALNLLRNRKGNAPHIVFVTFEPLPTRLLAISVGTGDIDCCYHAALPELVMAVEESANSENIEILRNLVDGRRLRDITDLPFDLAI